MEVFLRNFFMTDFRVDGVKICIKDSTKGLMVDFINDFDFLDFVHLVAPLDRILFRQNNSLLSI